MRYIEKPEDDKTDKLGSQSTYDELLLIATNKDKNKISDTIYRDSYSTKDGKGSFVEDQLALSYLNKCGYCERICKADIEHYRPKKKVDNVDHDGYYWLCYEWTNLLPSCVTCNREGAKHTKFSVLGTRVEEPSFLDDDNLNLEANKAHNNPLIKEIPGLLHPEIDEPKDYFDFEVISSSDGIRLKPKKNTQGNLNINERALQTIKICKLNRQELRLDRLNIVVQDFLSSVECSIELYDGEELVEDIERHLRSLKFKSGKEKFQHTLLRKFIVSSKENFESIVIPFCEDDSVKNILLVAYETVLG